MDAMYSSPRAYSSGMSEGGIGCDTNTIFSAHVSRTGCPIFMMNDKAFTSCCGLSYLTSSRTTIRFSGSWAISTISLLISDLLSAKAIGCWLRGLRGRNPWYQLTQIFGPAETLSFGKLGRRQPAALAMVAVKGSEG